MPFKPPHIAGLKKRVGEHRSEGRAQGKGEAKVDSLFQEPLHNQKERDVRFCDRFIEPVFFKRILMLRMPDKRKVGMKDNGEIPLIPVRSAPY
jgi:hypothetical protein